MDAIRLMRIACRIEERAPHLADELESMARFAQLEISVPQAELERMYGATGGAKPVGGSTIGGYYQSLDLGPALEPNTAASQAAMNMVIGGKGGVDPKAVAKEAQRRGLDPSILMQHARRAASLYSMGYTNPSILNRMMGQSGNVDLIAISNSPAAGFSAMGGIPGIRRHERAHMQGATGTRQQMMDRAMSRSRNIGGGALNPEQMENYWNSVFDWMMAGRNSAEEYGANMPIAEEYVIPRYTRELQRKFQ